MRPLSSLLRSGSETQGRPCGSSVRMMSPSKSVQPTIASTTVNSLSSPLFGQFASYLAPENRGVGGSTPPLTTSDSGSYTPLGGRILRFSPEAKVDL